MTKTAQDAPILILGATSGIGKATMKQALARGHKVRAFARSAHKLDPREGMEAFKGDARSNEDIAEALKGVRAVVFALGIKERLGMLWEEETLFSDATRVLVEEMPKAGISRIVAVTGFAAGRSKSAMSAIEKLGFMAIFRKPYEDKDRQEEMLIASDLDYTIARPTVLTNGAPSPKFKVLREPDTWRMGLVSRQEVAAYLLDAIEQDLDVRSDVVLTR
ncbi:MAG: NAD(P)-binding oxidoreductase [Pseudomonadota bacterium]